MAMHSHPTEVIVRIMLTLWTIATSVTCSKGNICRCSDSKVACWPTQEEWNSFNVTLDGRLIAPKPTGNPCHDPHFNATTCQNVRNNRMNSYMRAGNAGSMQNENWEEDDDKTCAMNASKASICHQGLVPILGVQVEAIQDVQNAIRFATLHNLRVVIKTSGHDLLGRSAAANSFLIWMHKFKKITIHESFTPESGCAHHGAAITIVGGVPWGEVYDALEPTGYILVGGMSLTVGAGGGFVQGGGHGALSPTFGLAVDSVLQMEVVTADATLRVTNECQERDLFFALRGGGGGTFGVVTSVTYKLNPNPSNFVGAILQLNPPNGTAWTTATQEEILTVWAQGTAPLDAAHWAGYWSFNPNLFFGDFLVPATETAARATFNPVVQALSQIQNVTTSLYLIHSYSTFQEWHRAAYGLIFPLTHTDYTGARGVLGSRIIPFSALKNPRGLAKTIVTAMQLSESSSVLGHMVVGPGVRMGDPLRQTSVTPAWREGLWHLITQSTWSWDATEMEKTAARIQTRSFSEMLHTAFPEAGAYVNEASVDELDWMRSFWGLENYGRLRATKLRVDPLGLFICRQCVGSELWSEDGNCIKDTNFVGPYMHHLTPSALNQTTSSVNFKRQIQSHL